LHNIESYCSYRPVSFVRIIFLQITFLQINFLQIILKGQVTMSLKIVGTGSALPDRIVTNDELTGFLDTSDEWIVSRTGIIERRVCVGVTTLDLAYQAAVSALSDAGLAPNNIDIVICSTISGNYITPSLACCVIEKLGIECPAFDISAACPGFTYALDIADAYISSGKANNVLIVSAERISGLVDWTDRSSCVLFGDGAAACVATQGGALKYSRLTASGGAETLCMPASTGYNPFTGDTVKPGYIQMQGPQTFKFAVKTAEAEIRRALETLGLDFDSVDYFIMHQANKRIIESVRTKLNQPEGKFPVNIDRYGNTSSATIPLLLDQMRTDGFIKKGSTLVLTAFGAGNTAGTCVLVWE
jgi:3-oxoacyl-[acyl-carrier-protein] synthase-3